MEEDYQLLLNNPEYKISGFKLINIFLSRYDPSIEQIEALEAAGVNIEPSVCIANYRYQIVEYLIQQGRLNPNDYIHDFCLYPYQPKRPNDFLETLKILVFAGCDLNAYDRNGRTPLDSLECNRSLAWIGRDFLKKEMKKQKINAQ
jgi:hypothetical protein